MTQKHLKINHWLLPLAWVYGRGVALRNKLFDWGLLRSKSFALPVICIGNLAVGGPGKTPHTEYLIKLLLGYRCQVATLSRGYGRKTKGYLLATEQSTASELGDEPYQMKQKFHDVRVSVCEDRCLGIEQLLKLENQSVDVILLDDAFQHRYVKAGLNILLTDYHRLFCDDKLLPAGRLRESIHGKNRAHIVVVTKCPDDIKPIDFNIIGKRLNLYPCQQLYFSRMRYGKLRPLFGHEGEVISELSDEHPILLLTGIAQPAPLLHEVQRYTSKVQLLAFADHQNFGKREVQQIEARFKQLGDAKALIVTTEKDAARLYGNPYLSTVLQAAIYVWPIEIEFLQNQQDTFNQNIISYVRKNQRNC